MPVVVIEKPVNGNTGSDLPLETMPVIVVEKPISGGTAPIATPEPSTPIPGGGSSTGNGFGDRFTINPVAVDQVEMIDGVEKTDIIEDLLEDNDMEKETDKGFGGLDGLNETIRAQEPAMPELPVYDVTPIEEADNVPGEPSTPEPVGSAAKSGGKKWLWMIVAGLALWFILKKK